MLQMPPEGKDWRDEKCEEKASSVNSEIVRSIRYRMRLELIERAAAERFAQGIVDGSIVIEHGRSRMSVTGDRIHATTKAIARRFGNHVTPDMVRRWARLAEDPLRCFRLGDGHSSPLCARETAIAAWMARREARGLS